MYKHKHPAVAAITTRSPELSSRSRAFLAPLKSYRLRCAFLGCSGVLFEFLHLAPAVAERIQWGGDIESDGSSSWMRCPACSRRNFLSREGWFGPLAILRVENDVAAPPEVTGPSGTLLRTRCQPTAPWVSPSDDAKSDAYEPTILSC